MTAVADNSTDTQWVVREDVPLLDAHVAYGINNKTKKPVAIPIDGERLQRIADKRNALVARSGDESPICIGHTSPNVPETKQPPVVGYAEGFYVGNHPSDGRPTLYAKKFKLYPTVTVEGEQLAAGEVMRRWPRRSPELWIEQDDLDTIALLGPTTPRRHLGLLRMSKTSGNEISFDSQECQPMGGDLNSFLAALQDLIAHFSGAGAGGAGPDAGMGGAAAAAPTQYSRPAATATKLNELASVPGVVEFEKLRMQREQDAIRIAELERRDKLRDVELAGQRLLYQRADREKQLIQLEAEGFIFDRAEELEMAAPLGEGKRALTDDEFATHVKRIKMRYQRAGSPEFFETAHVTEGGGRPSMTSEQRKKAVSISANRGIPYEQAMKEVMNGAAN